MIQVKWVIDDCTKHVDENINDFLQKKGNSIKVIDIKFTISKSLTKHALIIYEEEVQGKC